MRMRHCPIRLTAFSAATIATMCAAAALNVQPGRVAMLRCAGPTDTAVYRLVVTAAAMARDMSRQQTMPAVAQPFESDDSIPDAQTRRIALTIDDDIRPSRHVEYRLIDLPPPAQS